MIEDTRSRLYAIAMIVAAIWICKNGLPTLAPYLYGAEKAEPYVSLSVLGVALAAIAVTFWQLPWMYALCLTSCALACAFVPSQGMYDELAHGSMLVTFQLVMVIMTVMLTAVNVLMRICEFSEFEEDSP